MKFTKTDALRSLGYKFYGSELSSGETDFTFFDGDIENIITAPSDEVIQTEVDRLQREWETNEYARKRIKEYPTIEELVVALYDTEDKAAIDAKRAETKTKYPKP